ncbi:MAG: hypothetical protein LC644_01760, partial [Pseudonocardia sp.]|nr:hypothetical protein [Pseudonocardia sp.]
SPVTLSAVEVDGWRFLPGLSHRSGRHAVVREGLEDDRVTAPAETSRRWPSRDSASVSCTPRRSA